jgi:chromosome segregation ATPase
MGIPPVSETEETMSFGDKVVAQIRGPVDDRRLPAAEVNPLQKAYDDYNEMKRACAQAQHDANEHRIHNQALMAEVSMLRDALERCETDRVRLQSVSSTLLGRLLAINDTIAGAVKESIKHGIEAVEAARPEETAELDEAGAEAAEIIGRTVPAAPGGLPPATFLR